ncbi:uncharacterized protein LOC127006072 [Eriocheir sinensis]|uniref:uncharacterized protein LOC127006072 n=1 Tax=Eriocheir sinensis TaxID=95602 RepID=UPI0021C701D1|nr:uncharacterized protein LOC127006072 [Eriocheir sinensis]
MTASSVMPRRLACLFFLLSVAGGGWCQTLLDPEPRTCRTQNTAAAAAGTEGHRNEYPAGGVLMVLANVPAGLFGSLEVFLCPDGEAKVECLDRVPLQLADGSGTNFDLSKVTVTDKYEVPVILPDGLTCPTCTLQMRVVSRGCEDEAECPPTEDVTCANLTVREIKVAKRRFFRWI